MNDENFNNENINIICTVESKEKYLCDDCLYCCEYETKYCSAVKNDCPATCTECEYFVKEWF